MTKEEFKKIRQSLKLNGHGMAQKLRLPITEIACYETGQKSIPSKIEQYLLSIKLEENNKE